MQDYYLSKNFRLSELIKSQTALRHSINNTPSLAIAKNLEAVAANILQPVRDRFGVTNVSSGYRCLELNRRIGSKDNSQHTLGLAVDFECPNASNLEVYNWIKSSLEFDQLILEFYDGKTPHSGWVHCSYSPRNRKQAFAIA